MRVSRQVAPADFCNLPSALFFASDFRAREREGSIKTLLRLTATVILAAFNLSAATLYVSLASPNPTPPYTNWATAATNIQDAVDAARSGDTDLVTNGVYATGTRGVGGLASSQQAPQRVSVRLSRVVIISAPVHVQVVNR